MAEKSQSHCIKCGAPISSQSRFCDACGARIETRMLPILPASSARENPWGVRLLVVGGLLLLAAAVLVAMQSGGDSNSSAVEPKSQQPSLTGPVPAEDEKPRPEPPAPPPTSTPSDSGDAPRTPEKPSPRVEPFAEATDVETLEIDKWESKICETYLTDSIQVIPMKIFEIARTLDPISDEREMELGKKFLNEKNMLELSEDARSTAYVKRLGAMVAKKSVRRGIKYTFELVKGPECNAFAGPGARITVLEGMLSCVENEAQLVNVLAHEVAHIDRRHIGSVLLAIERIHNLKLPIPIPQNDREMIVFFGKLSYSQEAEIEADRLALKWSMELGYSPAQPVAFWEKMAAREARPQAGDPEGEFENIWRTHPYSSRRACILRNESIRHNTPNTQKIWYVGKKNLQRRITMQEQIF